MLDLIMLLGNSYGLIINAYHKFVRISIFIK